MLPSNPICAVCDYGTSATYRDLPSDEQLRNGVVPLDSLPAAWWNCMWNMTNHSINQARSAVGVLIEEINTVLTQAGVCACDICVDQLYKAIDNISQTVGNAVRAGAVKSSSCCGQVSIDNNGIMTANGLGNAACLTTTAQNAIGAINELKSTYDGCWSANATALDGKAPTSHASSDNTYGVGSAANYGHLKISDQYTSVLTACSGVAASQQAVACVYCYAAGIAAAALGLGNTNGCALGTASAGTATTAARSDHVHPKPSRTDLGFGTAVNCDATAFLAASGCATDSAKLTGKAPSALCVACAGANGSGTAFGAAAVCGTRAGGSVTHIPYSGTDGCPLLTSNFLAYWNGAYASSGASNLRYFCGGTFGSAATCGSSAFRSCTWIPDQVTACSIAASTAATRNICITACNSSQRGSTTYCCTYPQIILCAADGTLYLCSDKVDWTGVSTGTHTCNAHFSAMPASGANAVRNMYFHVSCTNGSSTLCGRAPYICGADGKYYGDVCGTASCAANATCATNASRAASATLAQCANRNGSGTSFGTAAVCSASCFIAASTVSSGCFGCAHWSRDPRAWQVYINATTATADCNVYKAFCCATNGFKGFLTGACQGVTGQFIRDSDKRGANTLMLNNNTSLSLGNYNMGACINISGTSNTTRNWCGFMIAGTYLP